MNISKFIKIQDSYVNLEHISNVNPLEHRNRIVYNFSYPIIITVRGKPKIVSEYIYDDYDSTISFESALSAVYNNQYIQKNFITQGPKQGLINKSKISSFKVQEDKLRVIFNMSHSIEIDTRNGQTVQPEFIYINLNSKQEFDQYIEYLNKNLV